MHTYYNLVSWFRIHAVFIPPLYMALVHHKEKDLSTNIGHITFACLFHK